MGLLQMDPAKAETYFEQGRAAAAERDKAREVLDEQKANGLVYPAFTADIDAKHAEQEAEREHGSIARQRRPWPVGARTGRSPLPAPRIRRSNWRRHCGNSLQRAVRRRGGQV